MGKTSGILTILLLHCLILYGTARITPRNLGTIHNYPLAALGGSGIRESTFQRRWRIFSDVSSNVDDALYQELVKLLKDNDHDQESIERHQMFINTEATKIRNTILPRLNEVYLNKYYDIKLIKHRGFLSDVLTWLIGEKEFMTYSAWQYRPNILYKGGNLTLEIHYKFPIKIGQNEVLFKPIVIYTCDVSPGKYVEGTAIFNPGTIEVLTHPFLPWKKIPAGSFQIYAPSLPTVFQTE